MKCWIFEKFETREEMEQMTKRLAGMVEYAKSVDDGSEKAAEAIKATQDVFDNHLQMILDNPEGRWYGFEGKVKYNEFCYTAKAALRRNPDGKFRVVEGEIDDNAKYWLGYKTVNINDGVLRYLMATK